MSEKGTHRGPMHRGGGVPVEKAKDFKGTVMKLIRYMGRFKVGIFIALIFTICSTVFNIFGPKLLGNITSDIFAGMMDKVNGGLGIDFEAIGFTLLMLLGLYAISALFNWVQGFIMSTISQKIAYQMRKALSHKMHLLPMNYYDQRTYGEILSRITNDVDLLGQSLSQTITQLISSVAMLIGIFGMMMSISPLMTLIAVLILPVSGVLVMLIVSKSQRFFRKQQEYLGHVNGQVEEVFGGHNVIKLFCREEQAQEDFTKVNDVLCESAWKSQFLSGLMQPVMNFIGNIGYVAVAVVGGYLSIQGTIRVGDIQSFIQYVRQFTQPIGQMAQVSNMLQSAVAAAERVFEFLEEPEEEQKAKEHASMVDPATGERRNVTITDLSGNVEFDHVQFGYRPDKIIIHDFSVKVKNGQKIAIVGPTGAGKTTIVKLLMRFYDLNGGEIRIDGYPLPAFDRSELREAFGMVLQDTWLFNGTIMENIRYGRLDATDEEVIEAAKAAKVHHFIQTLPGGYQMVLNEEVTNISQGQKQLLTIARAILANNKILILDEATSSVDTRTEIQIQEAMDHLMEGRTSFIIAHRLSTIRNADWILFLKDGDVVEQGTHDELLAKGGAYAELYNSQFQETA